jgi:cation diffusion facilitator CzcD-associated flavoprotein CzcO
MDSGPIETDYLVIGAGATAMAFVDTLLDESDADVTMVDRRPRPGTSWRWMAGPSGR